jgi:hypothetical protein
MFLFELRDPLIPKITVVVDQLKTELDGGELTGEFTVDNLLQYLQQYDIIVDKNDLYNMIKYPPMNRLISNIQADKVIFKGQEEVTPDTDKSQDIVKSMAKDAAKNLK